MGSSRPSGRAFVVEYNGEVDVRGGQVTGRVEHIASGRRQRFASDQEMLQFVARVLGEEGETTHQAEGR
jgi:hypothetical protein